jgi:hypothetical protein
MACLFATPNHYVYENIQVNRLKGRVSHDVLSYVVSRYRGKEISEIQLKEVARLNVFPDVIDYRFVR